MRWTLNCVLRNVKTSWILSSRSLQVSSDRGVLKGTEALIVWRSASFEAENDFGLQQDVQMESIGGQENGTGVYD